VISGGDGDDTLIGGAGNDLLFGGKGSDTIDVSLGNDTVSMTNKLDGFDIILGFDGNATGGQDELNLAGYFSTLGVADSDRAERVGIIDNGAVVDVWIDKDGNGSLDAKVAEIHTTDAITLGADIGLIPTV